MEDGNEASKQKFQMGTDIMGYMKGDIRKTKKRDRVDELLDRAQACLQKIQHLKASLLFCSWCLVYIMPKYQTICTLYMRCRIYFKERSDFGFWVLLCNLCVLQCLENAFCWKYWDCWTFVKIVKWNCVYFRECIFYIK